MAASVVVLSLLFMAVSSTEAWAADTTQFPIDPSRHKGVAIPFEGYTDHLGGILPISGAVGVDLVLGMPTHKYLPCQNLTDKFINACEERGSYTTYTRFRAGQGLLFPYGYFMGNMQRDIVTDHYVQTDWGRRATNLSVEFYPELSRDREYVHPRFQIDHFNPRVNGWAYSAPIGRITVLTLADPGTTRVSGGITDGGKAIAKDRVRILVFGGNASSSTGYPVSSFAVWDSAGETSWTSGAMYAGTQLITVTDKATGHTCDVRYGNMTGSNNHLDFDISQPGFGRIGRKCNFGTDTVSDRQVAYPKK
ncbi:MULTISPECIES: hypothetical protein [unclassified Pseudofrankia]|uniref:hypothetical protein n=1 Tax=unclassified Pseudofrankia TaxID=2994372 RepID=UPI000B161D3A|nr:MULTISPECIES: hypothetical protein [unclassified Pseudofrankia]MDT3438628.1 hypothetical protein [Pseudofrankia sp. BMG5.37]